MPIVNMPKCVGIQKYDTYIFSDGPLVTVDVASGNPTLRETDNITFKCNVKSNPPADIIQWFRQVGVYCQRTVGRKEEGWGSGGLWLGRGNILELKCDGIR